MIPLEGFLPDADPTTPGILTDCSNLVPFEAGFMGAPSPVAANVAALSAACIGAAVATQLDGTRRVIAGTAAALYELTGGTWTARTRGTGAYNGGVDTRWSLCQFGDTTVAANYADTLQSSSSGAFADIAGAPRAKIVVSASNNFVLAFNTVDATYGTSQDRWWCCAQNDQTSWKPDVSTAATTGRLIAVEGPIQAAVTLGDYVVAYKQRGMFLGQFVGAPVVWQWAHVPGGEAGAVGPEAVCDIGGMHFIVGNDNFWVFDGTRPIPLGVGEVRQWFLANSNPAYRYRTKVSYDRQTSRVSIYFASLNSSTPDTRLVFHVGTKKWGRADLAIEAPLNFISPGVTINQLDNYAATIDALPNVPVDSQYWSSGGQVSAVFDTAHQLKTLNGASGSSSFTTGDVGDDDQVTMIDWLRVRFSQRPTTATATGFTKFAEGDTLSAGASGALNDGKFDLRQSGRFHRFRLDLTGDHKATGYAVKPVAVGLR